MRLPENRIGMAQEKRLFASTHRRPACIVAGKQVLLYQRAYRYKTKTLRYRRLLFKNEMLC